MLTDDFTASIAEAEKLITTASHIETPQDLNEGYQYLAACIEAVLHSNWASELAQPMFLSGTGPFTKQGLDNPDTLYFGATISDDTEYVVTGKRGSTADLSFQILAGAYTDTNVPASVMAFDDRELTIDPDGSFVVRLTPEGDDTDPNHLKLPTGATQLLVREVYSDWAAERGTITIERSRTAGRPIPELTADAAAGHFAKAGRALVTRVKTWLAFPKWFYLDLPVNTLTEPRLTPGGLATQYSSVGHYDLADDEAMIITVPNSEAPYQGFQLGSMWYISLDYLNHQTSLNSAQSQVDPDGKIRLVVSNGNPGIANWIETTGHAKGILQFRWQRLDRELTAADGPTSEIVKLDEVAARLPYYAESTISAEDFAARIAARKAAVTNRMQG